MPCECWGDSLKKVCFANKIEKFYVSMYKELLGVTKDLRSMKILAFENYAFKLRQIRFKAFQEENLAIDGWVK